jgi:hypothetical protein
MEHVVFSFFLNSGFQGYIRNVNDWQMGCIRCVMCMG